MMALAKTIRVGRSQLHARAAGTSKTRARYPKAGDDDLLPALRRLAGGRPTYGYRRITALLNRERRAARLEPAGRKREPRILGPHDPALKQVAGRREGRVHGSNLALMASNLR